MKLIILSAFFCSLTFTFVFSSHSEKNFTHEDLNNPDTLELYKSYLSHHPHKKYSHDSNEGKNRFQHFLKNLDKINKKTEENKKNGRKWQAGLNNLSDYSEEELQTIMGHIEDTKNTKVTLKKRKLRLSNETNQVSFPAAPINWVSLFNPPRDQGLCGCCWAMTTTAVLEGMIAKKNGGTPIPYLSPQELVNCYNTANPCHGNSSSQALTWISQNGIVSDSVFPFTAQFGSCTAQSPNALPNPYTLNPKTCRTTTSTITKTVTIDGKPNVTTTTKTTTCQDTDLYAVLQNGPVAVTIDGTAIQHYTGGIFDSPCTTLNHAVTLVGYGVDSQTNTEYWLIRNSWNTTWGENGYIRVQRDQNNNNSCFIANQFIQPIF